MAEIVVRELVRLHGRQVVVDDLSFRVADGTITALIGGADSGKMTVLRCIAGVEKADHGDISVGGEIVNRLKAGRRDVAIIFHNHALLPHASVRDNIAFPLKFLKLPKAEAAERVAAAAEQMGLSDVLDARPRQLTEEQKHRTGVARAVVRRPGAYLVQDAPSSAPESLRALIRREVQRLHRDDGATVLFATDDGYGARILADHAVVLEDGRAIQAGTMADIFERPRSLGVAALFDELPLNRFRAKVRACDHGTAHLRLKGGAEISVPARADELEPGEILTLGIWPEDLACGEAGEVKARIVEREARGVGEILELDSAAGSCRVKLGTASDYPGGGDVWLQLPPDKCMLFDDQGAAIGRGDS